MTHPGRTQTSFRPQPYPLDDLALQACLRCRSSKRKCDRLLPHCSRCTRLRAECLYSTKSGTPDTTANGALATELQATVPFDQITASQVLSLIAADARREGDFGWADAVRSYFEHVHSWFAVVHCSLFEEKLAVLGDRPASPATPMSISSVVTSEKPLSIFQTLDSLGSVPDPDISKEFALLILTMYMTTRPRLMKSGERTLFDDLYWLVKRALASSFSSEPKLELVQSGALLAFYEYGHGEPIDAYGTLSKSVTAASRLDVKPTRLDEGADPSTMEEEERSGLWWALFILDQFLHIDDVVKNLPFIVKSPEMDTLLPGPIMCPPLLDHKCKPRSELPGPLPISALLDTQKMESFQMSAKVATLLHRALQHEHKLRASPGFLPPIDSFSSLDAEIREATMILLRNDVNNWQVTLDCFSMAISALFSIYLPYLPMLEAKTAAEIKSDPSLTTAMTALGFASQLAVDISCKVSNSLDADDKTAELDYLVAPAVPTCYLAVKTCTSLRQIFPDEWERFEKAIVDRLGSLRFFNNRWGIADRVMRQIQELDGLDPFELLSYNSPSAPR
ncbi:hypothetical protein JX265_011772 [Neoarthrinium moseri]|uniref:Zn(2)-C6 fungal-type domain-containing protein n=1 Tax=Neoarthrinium moseri TaxID=1658444 RepID=A0A9P9WC24_9PEZI|nr:hypothetical protein JX266_005895 [Neoarthrinium moseri]KAI1856260.1 hypothetical protein JX265_011772 [Neoarthrinium moseri]